MNGTHTLLFSDVHLGSPVSRAYEVLSALKEYRFKKLIINGDMFEDLNFEKLTSTHWELLEHIGKLSRRDVEVVWIAGNHDAKFAKIMAYLIGIPVHDEHIWQIGSRRFLALHGHQFDSFMVYNAVIGKFLAVLYTTLQRMVSSVWLDWVLVSLADRWQRLSRQVADGAIEYSKKHGCDVVICGHTHRKMTQQKADIEYYNLGCCNSMPSHFLTVSNEGIVQYREIP